MFNTKEKIKELQDEGHNVLAEFKDLSMTERLAICDSQRNDVTVVCLNLTGDLNIGSIIRTAAIFCFKKVVIIGRKFYDKRSTVGAQNYIEVEFIQAFNGETLEFEKIQNYLKNYFCIFVEQHKTGQHPRHIADYCINNEIKDVAIVLGNENMGIDNYFIEQYYPKGSRVATINQRGVMRSLNVSNAAAIVMHYFV